MAITQINQGRLAEAVDMLDDAVQASSQPNFSAHLARGTARALQRKLKGARTGPAQPSAAEMPCRSKRCMHAECLLGTPR